MIASFDTDALPAAEGEVLEKLLKKIHEPYDPFQDWEDWRLWMLCIRGNVLDLTKAAPAYSPAIARMLAVSVMGLALHDLQKRHDTEGRELRRYAKTHPLLSAEEVPEDRLAYVDNWGFVHWQRQKRLIALIQLYEYLTQPVSDWMPPEIKQVNFPKPWLEYIDSFDLGFRMSLWGRTEHWNNAAHAQTTTELQSPSQASASNKQSISDLCRAPFSKADFSELLVRLGVIDSGNNCLTNDLKGPARGKRGAFIAAYRVLHRARLMEPATDSQVGEALRQEYKAELGTDALAHQLTANGSVSTQATADFKRAVDKSKAWLDEWKNRHNMTDNA